MNRLLPAALVAALLLALAMPAGAATTRGEVGAEDAGRTLVADVRAPSPTATTPGGALAALPPRAAHAAERGYADEHDVPWADQSDHWFAFAECTEITAAVFLEDEDDEANNYSPYGWDVSVVGGGGDPVPMHSNLHGFFGLTWELHGAEPGETYTLTMTPRAGYPGEVETLTVTTSEDCPASPGLELLEATRSSTTYVVTGAEDANGVSAWALGAGDQRYAQPLFVLAEFGHIPAGEPTTITIIAPAGAAHVLGFALHNDAGRGTLAQATVDPMPDERIARRVSGSDRFATATALAADATPVAPTTAIVANGLNFPDALAAANYGTPVLLTTRDALHPEARRYLEGVALERVVVAGGRGVVSDEVLAQIRQAAPGVPVDRIGGTGRYETGAGLAGDAFGDTDSYYVIVASGETHADALAAGALSAAGGIPLLLTAKGQLPEVTGALLEELDPGHVLIAGGTAAIEEGVLDAIRQRVPDATIERLFGPDRTRTAAAIATWGTDAGAFARVNAILARGDTFADALAASAVAGFRRAPVLLSASPTAMGLGVPDFLDAYGCVVEQLIVAGGTGAVSQGLVDSQTGACDPTVADQLQLESVAVGMGLTTYLLQLLDDTRRGEGHLDYVLGPDTPRDEDFHTAFDSVGDVGAVHLLPAPLAWRVADPAGADETLMADDVTTLLLDRNNDRACNDGEPAFDFTLASYDGEHRVCP